MTTTEFACYEAACRPPTSGGTGGSSPKRSLVTGLEHLNPTHRAKFEASLAKIPADIQQLAAKHGVTIEVRPEVRTGERGRIDFGGLYVRSDRKVLVGPKGLDHPDSDVLLHEFGHAWDHVLGDVSKTPPYKALHREAKPRVPYFKTGSPPDSTGAQELFAEGFAQHYGGYTRDFFTLTDNMRTVYDQLRHNVRTGEDLVGEALMELACHDAACAPPPVGTGGSKPGGPARGVLSPKASERKNVPVPVTTSNYELRKHGLRELFNGPIGSGGLEFGDDTDVRWLDDEKGWFIEGSLTKGGEYVGHFERYIGLKDGKLVNRHIEGGKLVATHETLILEDDHQGKGYAKAFNDHLMTWYQKVGVDRIELRAGFDMGPYVWATQGYRIQGVEGGENRKRWVDNRLKQIEQRDDDPELRTEVRALRKANERGEDIQPIHVASIGQNDPALHWHDEKYGDMWPGKDVLIEEHYHNSDDRTREYDGVYYLEGRETPATVASAINNLLTRG